MAAKTSSTQQDFLQRFRATLSYACSELCLIVLLHVAAVASYAATRLAGICRLKAPCILCSRLDHALHGKPWFSADLVCPAHRSEISSLAYCNNHNQLARSEDFCKRCLLACTGSADNLTEDVNYRSTRLCSCCLEPFKNSDGAQKLTENTNAVESTYNVHRSKADGLNQIYASDNTHVMTPMVVSGQVPADHLNEKTLVVGIEEINESDGSQCRDEHYAKQNGTSANTEVAKTVSTRSFAPSRIFVDRNSSVKNAFIGRLNLPSPRPSEIIFSMDNNSTTQQEVNALLSQTSSRGLDNSSSEGTPRPAVSVQPYESNAMARTPSLERIYSVFNPSDGNLVDNIEGESSIENLRKQLELSRKSLAVLYKELEEERSASAVAASQAMAMIHRLQEEKAAIKMEALQYLRMMEEQADHDHEEIQNLHDLLTDREKELLDMESELANCQRLLQNEPLDAGRFDGADTMKNTGYSRNVAFEFMDDTDFMGSMMSYFEDEKAYILESLSTLEQNFCISTSKPASDNAKNDQEDIMLEDHHTRAHGQCMENTQLDGRDSLASQEHLGDESTFVQQHDENKILLSPSENYKMNNVPSVKSAILLLNTRLKTLEVDQKFLKEVLNSLTCGSDGLQRVQEVASHLAELRRVVTQRRAMSLPLVHTIWS